MTNQTPSPRLLADWRVSESGLAEHRAAPFFLRDEKRTIKTIIGPGETGYMLHTHQVNDEIVYFESREAAQVAADILNKRDNGPWERLEDVPKYVQYLYTCRTYTTDENVAQKAYDHGFVLGRTTVRPSPELAGWRWWLSGHGLHFGARNTYGPYLPMLHPTDAPPVDAEKEEEPSAPAPEDDWFVDRIDHPVHRNAPYVVMKRDGNDVFCEHAVPKWFKDYAAAERVAIILNNNAPWEVKHSKARLRWFIARPTPKPKRRHADKSGEREHFVHEMYVDGDGGAIFFDSQPAARVVCAKLNGDDILDPALVERVASVLREGFRAETAYDDIAEKVVRLVVEHERCW